MKGLILSILLGVLTGCTKPDFVELPRCWAGAVAIGKSKLVRVADIQNVDYFSEGSAFLLMKGERAEDVIFGESCIALSVAEINNILSGYGWLNIFHRKAASGTTRPKPANEGRRTVQRPQRGLIGGRRCRAKPTQPARRL